MTVKCRLLDGPPNPFNERKPGDMWFCPWYVERDYLEKPGFLSEFYRQEYHKYRAPIAVVCPDRSVWMVDTSKASISGSHLFGR